VAATSTLAGGGSGSAVAYPAGGPKGVEYQAYELRLSRAN